MRAALLTAVNQPLEVEDVEPASLGYGQVLVKVLASGICGAQLQEIRGEKGTHFPRLMGHEGCGEVVEAGPGVKTVRNGSRVVMHWRKGAGIESEPPRWYVRDRIITGGQVVTFAAYALCSENRITEVPSSTPVELCALLGCGLSTALGTIENEAGLRFGETILIIGCGGLGLNLILAARLTQASHIAVIDVHPGKRAAAIQTGAHYFGASPISKADVIIDTSGSPEALGWALPWLAPSGRCIMVGQPAPGAEVVLRDARHFFEGEGKSLRATQGGRFQPHQDIPRYAAMHSAGLLDLTGLITHRIGLDQINEGLDLVRNGEAGRVLIEMP